MKYSRYIPIIYLSLTMLTAIGSAPEKSQSSDLNPPNVVLILVDDMGWSDLGSYGSEVKTPHLDRLAADGIRFTQVYNTSKCFPSRASLLTGLYAQRIGYDKSYRQPMRHAMSLGELFKMAGYTTLWSGKHHSTERPTSRGFDHYSGLFEGASNHFNPGRQREGEGKPAQKRPDRPWVIDGEIFQPYTPDKDFYTTDAFTNYALDWLDETKDSARPFFLYLSYTAPHDPLMAWPKDIAKYRGKYRAGYEAIRRARFEKQKESGLLAEDHPLSASTFTPWDELDEDEQEEEALIMAVYAAMIDSLDQNIGRLLEKIEELGASDNTLILFASDNGASSEVVRLPGSGEIGSMTRWTSLGPDWANVSNTPLRYFKNWSYEGGIKTPLIAHWPAAMPKGNRVVDTPLHFIDFLPTFADLLDIDYPDRLNGEALIPLDGISFLPILEGDTMERNSPLFWQWAKGRAVREGKWKAVKHGKNWELYDLEADPVEANDLAEAKPEKLKTLLTKYEDWQASDRGAAEMSH